MKIGAMNYPRLNLIEEIKSISEMGFDFIDLADEWPSDLNSGNIDRIKKVLKDSKLFVIGHTNPTLPLIYPVESVRKEAIQELKRSINFLFELGARKINIHGFYYTIHMNKEEILERNIEIFKYLEKFCTNLGVELMLENFIAPFNNAWIFSKILKNIPNLKIHLDLGHLNFSENIMADLEEFISLFNSSIIHYHIHDNKGSHDDHLPLGSGNINWEKAAKIIKGSGYDGTFTTEIFSDKDLLLFSKNKWRKIWESI